jgi:hypothetical protein
VCLANPITNLASADISLSAQAGNSLAEYRGIWWSAMVGVVVMCSLG